MPQYSNLSGEETNEDSAHPHSYLTQSPQTPESNLSQAPSRLVQVLPALAALLTMGFIPVAEDPVGGLPWWGWVLIVIAALLLVVLVWWLLSGRERPAAEEHAPAAAHAAQVIETAPARVEVVAAEPAAPPQPVAAEMTAQPADDLEIIEGIGPKIAGVFKAAGMLTFQQLAQADPAHLQGLLREAGMRLADPTSWPEQARLAAAGQWDELKALQDRLKAGRA